MMTGMSTPWPDRGSADTIDNTESRDGRGGALCEMMGCSTSSSHLCSAGSQQSRPNGVTRRQTRRVSLAGSEWMIRLCTRPVIHHWLDSGLMTSHLHVTGAQFNMASVPAAISCVLEWMLRRRVQCHRPPSLSSLYMCTIRRLDGWTGPPSAGCQRVSRTIGTNTQSGHKVPRRLPQMFLLCVVLRQDIALRVAAPINPLIATLKPQSNGPSCSNIVIGTLTVDGWAVTFGTARRGLGRAV